MHVDVHICIYALHILQMDSYYGTMKNADIAITVDLAGIVVLTVSVHI